MQDLIVCQYRWTLEEFVTAHQEHRRHNRLVRRALLILWCIAVLSLAAAIVRFINFGVNYTSVVLLVVGIAILSSRLFSRRVLARMFAKLPDRDTDVRWEIAADRLVVETPASRTETAWTRIVSIIRTDKGFLIYPQPGIFYWLPFHSFGRREDIERVERCIPSELTGSGT